MIRVMFAVEFDNVFLLGWEWWGKGLASSKFRQRPFALARLGAASNSAAMLTPLSVDATEGRMTSFQGRDAVHANVASSERRGVGTRRG